MTGYGRGDGAQTGHQVTVEVSSVNRKQTEIAVYLPRELEPLEPRVRDEVNRCIARGRLTIRVNLRRNDDADVGALRLNVPLAKAYARELMRLAKELNLKDRVSLEALVRAPGVLQSDDMAADAQAFWPAVRTALLKALGALVRMREREGAHLEADLTRRIALMRKAVTLVQRRAPAVLRRYKAQLQERIRSSGFELPAADDERLLKELVYFADRSDITEELTRLGSHFKQFDDCLGAKEPVGRTLDFLAQEMNRELDTIGSKANDSLISRKVVSLKTELKKFREQVQNVE